MWTRFVNMLKHAWNNPVVQFICLAFLEDVLALFHRSTKNKFKHRKSKNGKDACNQDYSVGTSDKNIEVQPEEHTEEAKEVVVEKPKVVRKPRKKIVKTIEEIKPAKANKTSIRKKTVKTTDKTKK